MNSPRKPNENKENKENRKKGAKMEHSKKEDQPKQFWFFVYESTKSTNFLQGNADLADILISGITLKKCLELAAIKEKETSITKFTFWIHSESMSAAVQMLHDQAILSTWEIYCQKDLVVTIYIRDAKDDSPNTSRAASHQSSLDERRKVSRSDIPEILLRPRLANTTTDVDAFTEEPLKNFKPSEKVVIDIGGGLTQTFSKSYIMMWVTSQIESGSNPLEDFEILIWDETQTHTRKLLLTQAIWQHSLIRGPWKETFLPIWQRFNDAFAELQKKLHEMSKQNPKFFENARQFVRDLNHFAKDAKAKDRLEKTGHEFYIGPPYFTTAEASSILAMRTSTGTIESDMRKISDKKAATYDSVCAAHDLSPVYETALNMSWNNREKKVENLWQEFAGLKIQDSSNQKAGSKSGKKNKKDGA